METRKPVTPAMPSLSDRTTFWMDEKVSEERSDRMLVGAPESLSSRVFKVGQSVDLNDELYVFEH